MTITTPPRRRFASLLGLPIVFMGAFIAVGVQPAAATPGSNDYPNSGQAWCTTNFSNGASHTPPVNLTPPPNSNCTVQPLDTIVPGGGTSGFYKEECTSFVAWRMINDNGFTGFRNSMDNYTLGKAADWGTAAANMGFTVQLHTCGRRGRLVVERACRLGSVG